MPLYIYNLYNHYLVRNQPFPKCNCIINCFLNHNLLNWQEAKGRKIWSLQFWVNLNCFSMTFCHFKALRKDNVCSETYFPKYLFQFKMDFIQYMPHIICEGDREDCSQPKSVGSSVWRQVWWIALKNRLWWQNILLF